MTAASIARYAGAGAIVGGMSFAPQKTVVMAPLFLGGWAALAYGLTDGFKDPDPVVLGGIGAVVVGGMGARMTDNPTLKIVAKGTFMAGWVALAEGVHRETGTRRVITYGSSALVVAGASLIRARVFQQKNIPAWLGPVVFAAGWAGILYSAQRSPSFPELGIVEEAQIEGQQP